MLHYENVVYPEGCRGVIDVTREPWCLDNTGRTDCTEKLVRLLDSILEHNIPEMQAVYDELAAMPGDGKTKSNNFKKDGLICAFNTFYIAQQPTLYFPNGTYLVSDTVSYTLEELQNKMIFQTVRGHEMNRCIRFMGQNREKTVIRLKDRCKGFEFGQERPVISFMQGERSNVAYSNYFENLTIDVGAGNPGAVGLVFFSNNNGAVRNVTVRSSDPEHRGAAGILLRNEIHSACNFFGVEVDGFDYGVKITTFRTCAHFENVVLKDQRRYGFHISNNAVQIIGLHSRSHYPALCVSDGTAAHVVLTDAVLEGDGSEYEAVKLDTGACLFMRNIDVSGYAYALNRHWRTELLPPEHVDEYVYPAPVPLSDEAPRSLSLPVEPLPDLPRVPLSEWVCVNDLGAVGDGETDDTDAIQKAFFSGKKAVWFQPGRYLLSRPVEIPAGVDYVNFMFCDLAGTPELCAREDLGMFLVTGESDVPLLFEKLQAWYECIGVQKLVRHDSRRTLIMRDVHSQACASYCNTVPGGKVYLENVACTIGNRKKNGHVPCFRFDHQTVWAHAINPERCAVSQVENVGGILWWSGFKTEQIGSICTTRDGGVTEILGGVAVDAGDKNPGVRNVESTVSAIFTNVSVRYNPSYPVAVEEVRNGETRRLTADLLPVRHGPWYFLPLYSGRK